MILLLHILGLMFCSHSEDYNFDHGIKSTQLLTTKAQSLCSSPSSSLMSSLHSDDDSIIGNTNGKREEIDVVG